MTDDGTRGPAQAPPGWYDEESGRLRYWDGQLWTEHFAPVAPAPITPVRADSSYGEPAYARQIFPDHKRVVWPWIVGGIAVVAVILSAVIASIALLANVSRLSGVAMDPKTAVLDFDAAYKQGDCDLLVASTTERLRSDYEIETCEQFAGSSADFLETLVDYEVTVTSADVSDGTAIVRTSESYVLDGEAQVSEERYDLVSQDGTWKIDQITEPD